MARTGKRLRAAYAGIDRKTASFPLDQALSELKKRSKVKFDETVEMAVNLGVDPRHADQNVRGVVDLPSGSGKSVRVAVFAKDSAAQSARDAGADEVGSDELLEKMQGGDIAFDRVIATPDMMGLVGRLGKLLGPRGLMPNPRLGTVTPNVAEAVAAAKGGQVQFRVEKNGIVHAGIGKLSFSEKALESNARAFYEAIVKAKPSGAKGTYVKKVSITSTMGPGLKLDLATMEA